MQDLSQDVFILGYPFGSKWGLFPIWKRGSIATEPAIDISNLPYYFVDTASRSGMSGSPVVVKERRPVTIMHENGRLERYFTHFLGIYSGREGVTEDESLIQLGRVWKPIVIDEIIAGGILGVHGYENDHSVSVP